MKSSLPALLVLALALLGLAPSTPAPFVRHPIESKVYPGISVAVGSVAKGLITAQAYGYADIAAKRPLMPDTPLHIASVSKSVTATAVMQLVQSGKVSLEKPVSTYVPNFKNGAKITVRQLLDQSSGIPGHSHSDPIIHGDDAISVDEVFRKLNATPLFAAPGILGWFVPARRVALARGRLHHRDRDQRDLPRRHVRR